MSLQSLLENALQKRFAEDAAWNDPKFLKEMFSRQELNQGLVRISQSMRKRVHYAIQWISPYTAEEFEAARTLIKDARDSHPRFRKISAEEAANQETGKILDQKTGTPESFYQELQWEQRERDKGRDGEGGGLSSGR